jgi:hypothetical protein
MKYYADKCNKDGTENETTKSMLVLIQRLLSENSMKKKSLKILEMKMLKKLIY